MQNIILAIAILLAINALLLIFSVNRTDGTKPSKDEQRSPSLFIKPIMEGPIVYRTAEPNGTTVLRNIIKMEQKQKREWEPMGEGHNSIGQKGKLIQFPLTPMQEGPFKE